MNHNLALSVYNDGSTYNQRVFIAHQHKGNRARLLGRMRDLVLREASKQRRLFDVSSSEADINTATHELADAMVAHVAEFAAADRERFDTVLAEGSNHG